MYKRQLVSDTPDSCDAPGWLVLDFLAETLYMHLSLIHISELGAACGGGGRYDKMIGKFTGNDVPACGFSIGFERIIPVSYTHL